MLSAESRLKVPDVVVERIAVAVMNVPTTRDGPVGMLVDGSMQVPVSSTSAGLEIYAVGSALGPRLPIPDDSVPLDA